MKKFGKLLSISYFISQSYEENHFDKCKKMFLKNQILFIFARNLVCNSIH